jgi:hypothetical protein
MIKKYLALKGGIVLRLAAHTKCFLAMFALAALAISSSAQSVSLSATSLSFGSEVIGTTSGIKTVTLTNTGSAALAISSIVPSPIPTFAETTNCGATVKAGAQCAIRVTFTPSTAGTITGSLSITDNASNSPQTVSLTGIGLLPVTLAPAAAGFPGQIVGMTSQPVAFTLTNNLSTALTINSIATSGDFAQTNLCGNPLAAKTKCTVSVTFTPTLVGTRTGTLTVSDSATNSPQTSTLSGNGTASGLVSIALTPTTPTIGQAQTQQFQAIGKFANNYSYDLTQSAAWNSTRTNIATVNNSVGTKGLATALAGGLTSIKVGVGSIQTLTTLTVTSLTSISVTPTAGSIALGTKQQYTATGNYSNGSQQNLTNSVVWSSSAVNVATITSSGLATAVGAGSTTVSATWGSFAGSTTLAVNPAPCSGSGPCVLTYHDDLARDGVVGNETTLTPANVNSTTFGTLATITGLNGQIYAQPLYMSGLYKTSSLGNVVFLATEEDYVYAFDADTYEQVWSGSYIPAGETPIPTPGPENTCTNLEPNVGITGTPVIDPNTTFNPNPVMYFVTRSEDTGGNYHQRLHAVDVATGAEVFGGPVEITTPAGSPGPFDLLFENQRSGLVLTYDANQNPQIYIAWGSHCDLGDYRGWMMKFTVNAGVFNFAPSAYFVSTQGEGEGGGIWMSGGAPAVDNPINGNLYLATGNGTYDGTLNFGQSAMKFDSNLDVIDWYTPDEWVCLNGINGNSNCPEDSDLGSGGVVLFNVPNGNPELISAGKQGEIFVIYQANMGHLDPDTPPVNFNPPPDCTTGSLGLNNIAQCFPGIVSPSEGGSRATPAFWNGTLYTEGSGDALRAFSLDPVNIGSFITSGAVASTPATFAYPGSATVVSWNGTDPTTGILWVLQTAGSHIPVQSAVLWAYTAIPDGSGLDLLYQSPTGPGAIKFQVPTVANGKVFVAGQGFSGTGTEGQLYVFGLCPCN